MLEATALTAALVAALYATALLADAIVAVVLAAPAAGAIAGGAVAASARCTDDPCGVCRLRRRFWAACVLLVIGPKVARATPVQDRLRRKLRRSHACDVCACDRAHFARRVRC